MKRSLLCGPAALFLIAMMMPVPLRAFTLEIKVAPPEAVLYADGEAVHEYRLTGDEKVREYRFREPLPALLLLSAPGCLDRLLRHPHLSGSAGGPESARRLDVKLEPADSDMRLTGMIETGSQPKSVLFIEEGRRLAAALLDGPGVEIFDSRTLERVAVCSPPGEYAGKLGFVEMAELPRRGELWVSQMTTGTIHIFETGTWRWKESVSAGGSWPKVLAADPLESRVYVSLWNGASVAELDAATRAVLRRFPVPGIPRGLAVAPDGKTLYIANYSSGAVEAVSLSDGSRRSIERGPGALRHLVLNETGTRLYFSDMYKGTVGAIDSASGAVIWERRAGSNVNTIELDPDGRYLYASARGKNGARGYLYEGELFGTVCRIDAETGAITGRIWGGDQPTGLDISPDGALLVFSDFLDHRLEVYRTAADSP